MEQKHIEPNTIHTLRIAQNRSLSKKHKVGAILIDENNNVLDNACNTSLSQFRGYCENEKNQTFNYVSHAEENLIMKMIGDNFVRTHAKAIIITDYPCNVCARLIIQAGITNVYITAGYSKAHEAEFFDSTNKPYSMFDIFIQNNIKLYVENPANEGMFDLVQLTETKNDCIESSNEPRKRVLIHHIDADGFMSRYIAENYFDVYFDEIYPYNYEKDAQWMQDKDILDIYFVDVTPPIEWVENNPNINIYIFDHHPVVDNFKKFSNCNVYYNPNLSGCEICLDYFNSQVPDKIYQLSVYVKWLKYFTGIIGDYDTWRFTEQYSGHQKEVLAIHEYIKELLLGDYKEFENAINEVINFNRIELIDSIKDIGAAIVKIKEKQAMYNLEHLMLVTKPVVKTNEYDKTYFLEFYFEGYPDYYLQKLIQRNYKDVDVRYTGFKVQLDKGIINFSTRSLSTNKLKEHSAQALSQEHGGDGHLHAAGFSLPLKDGFELLKKIKQS